jgi:hypothetical protein
MPGKARRKPTCLWPALARRAVAVGGLWLAALTPAIAQNITAATYAGVTDRYAHGVLGDKLEWTTLVLTLDDGTERRFTLPDNMVFEDLAPRLADITGDGVPEVITVESSLSLGARLAIYTAAGRMVATEHIGQRNRWLAPVGAADFDGDGKIEIAYVDRPHLLQMLRLVRLEGGELREIARLRGVTNHRIGWSYIPGGVRTCTGRPEMILATGDFLANLSVFWRAEEQRLDTKAEGRFTGPESMEKLLRCEE